MVQGHDIKLNGGRHFFSLVYVSTGNDIYMISNSNFTGIC